MANYRVAVLGDHLGGLAAAALAARRGGRVLLLETADAASPRPFELLNAVAGGPEQEPGLGRLFQELGLAPFGPLGDDRIHFRALAPPLQVCTPRHRVSLHADRTARAWELQREFGDAARALGQLWQREEELRARLAKAVPERGAQGSPLPLRALASVSGFVRLQALEREVSRRGFGAYLEGQGLEPAVRAMLAAAAQAVCRRPAAGLTWWHGLRALRVANGGLYGNAAGQAGVLDGLRAVLLARGGDIRPLVALEGIDVPRSGGARLHLAAGGTVKAERVIVDLPLAEALARLPADQAKALGRKGLEEREEQEYELLSFLIAAARRPEEMGTYLAIDLAAGDPARPPVLLAAQAASAAGEGRCAVEALGIFPGAAVADRRGHVLECVRSVLPFLDESLVGEPSWRSGAAVRFASQRLGRWQREERLGAGWSTALFSLPPFTFLRNEDYAATPLAEALFSGALAAG